ncbi:MAG: hypothetical protein DMG61_14730 [Acidobacteria bacterium]|nr:MAG: hypothetical protein DMG61_14730 [Acidobacteriota bacterium]
MRRPALAFLISAICAQSSKLRIDINVRGERVKGEPGALARVLTLILSLSLGEGPTAALGRVLTLTFVSNPKMLGVTSKHPAGGGRRSFVL